MNGIAGAIQASSSRTVKASRSVRCHAVASICLDLEENAETGKSQAVRRAV